VDRHVFALHFKMVLKGSFRNLSDVVSI
jgi:hypothetical protein